MNTVHKRVVEIRLVVVVGVDIADPELTDAMKEQANAPVATVVSSEIVSNLESVSYVTFAIASPL